MGQVEGTAWCAIEAHGLWKRRDMGQQNDVSKMAQGQWEYSSYSVCGILAQFLHEQHALLPIESVKVLNRLVVRASQIRMNAIPRASVRPSVVSNYAGVTIERDDLPPIEVMKIFDLRAEGVDAGIDLCHRAAVIVVVAGYKKDGLGHARHGDCAKMIGKAARRGDVTGDGNAVRSGFRDVLEEMVDLPGVCLFKVEVAEPINFARCCGWTGCACFHEWIERHGCAILPH